jgi:hypothetical protein
MKLNTPLLSQRDSRWGSIFLGNNTVLPYNIYNYGCLITCLASYVNKTPAQVNQILKDNGGFEKNNGNFYWGKSTVLGLNQTYLSPSYTGLATAQGLQKIKDFLDQGYPLLCEVDFNPNTKYEEMHFVLIIGYEGDSIYAMDPWVGEIVNLSVYGGPQRAIIQFRAYDKSISAIAIQPPTPTPAVPVPTNSQPMEQVIKDVYRALCGVEPTKDEINYRFKQNINTYDLIKEICSGDQRFKDLWVKTNDTEAKSLLSKMAQLLSGWRG